MKPQMHNKMPYLYDYGLRVLIRYMSRAIIHAESLYFSGMEIAQETYTELKRDLWLKRQLHHEEKVVELLRVYLNDRSHQKKNPLMDFLFEYYHFRPAQLKRWSPGAGVLLGFEDKNELPDCGEWEFNGSMARLRHEEIPEKRLKSAEWILELFKNAEQKKPAFGCFGMHEWAMVYKSENPRHNQLPMRMPSDELARFVESRPLLCTHFDAFRFFTKEAVPLNRHDLSRENFTDTEQPGCIHTNMDLYKWAFKMYPWIGSDLILQAFKLACEARTIDMQASPYDMRDFGLEPIPIETEVGRKNYLDAQMGIFEKSKPVRRSLIEAYERLLELRG